MTSTNDGKDVKSNQTSGTKGKSFYIELYKSLEAGLSKDSDLSERTRNLCDAWRRVHSLCAHSAASTHPHLLSWLQRHTARTVLQTEWQDPENKNEHKRLEEAIDDFIKESKESQPGKDGDPPWQTQLVARGEWFKRILENPWGHPVLRVLLDPKRKESPKDEEVLEWLREERGVMFVTRLRQLASSKHCKDLALELASGILDRVRACMDPPKDDQVDEPKEKPKNAGQPTFMDVLKTEAGFTVDVMELLTDIEFVLLHKRDSVAQCIELAKQTPLRNGYQLVERLQSRQETSPREKKLWKNAKDVATLIAQVVIARCMVVSVCAGVSRTALYCCARSLARLLGAARLAPAAAALAAPAATARHLHTLALAVDSESKDDMKPFVCELYVRAITTGMNELERLKLNADKAAEARSSEQTLSQWFVQLGGVLAASERMRCECTLTAFSVHPSPAMYDKIQAAPALAPVALDIEPKAELTASEFGSWASDSRSQTNFVKTSETLKLKQTQHQANVLSTAILTEGETLQLSPELCQDIAVLLSGPRVKTLSWDTDRQLLLENCRTYMERTHFGTRALTTELKYLNLDLRQYQHLPEEDDDDSDMYYGIEKGYEHLVEFQEPEEIWEDADDGERTESAYSTDKEADIPQAKSKRKTKKICKSSEDENPLSTVAEAKRVMKKKERPHSKERSRVPKLKTKLKDPLEINDPTTEKTIDYSADSTIDHSIERQRDNSVEKKKVTSGPVKKTHSTERKKDSLTTKKRDQSTEKGKEPKDKDKKERKERKRKEKTVNRDRNPTSLSSLIGLKVTNMGNTNKPIKPTIIPTSYYDNQVKASMNSLLSETNEPDVVFDGIFSTESLQKSPETTAYNNKKMSPMSNSEAYVAKGAVRLTSDNMLNDTTRDYAPTVRRISTETSQSKTTLNQDVKKSITKLIEFRRQKALSESPEPTNSLTHPNLHTYSNKNIKAQNPQAQVSENKGYLTKSQSIQLAQLKDEVTNLLNNKDYIPWSSQQCKTSPKLGNIPSGVKILNTTSDKSALPKPSTSKDFKTSPKTLELLNRQNPHTSKDLSPYRPVQGHQKNFHDFLKDLQASINAGAGDDVNCAAQTKIEIKPRSRVDPVIPKSEPNVTQSAKQHVKKSEPAPNTFSRLSYYKTNKNYIKTKQFVEAFMDHQSQQLEKMRSGDLDRIITEQKLDKVKQLQSSSETVIKHTRSTDNTQKVAKKMSSKSQGNLLAGILQSGANLGKTSVIQNIQVDKHKPRDISAPIPNKLSALTEKDQQDLVNLLRQQSKQNLTRPKLETPKERVQPSQPDVSNICKVTNLLKEKGIEYKSVTINNPPLKPSSELRPKPFTGKPEQVHIKNLEETGIQNAKVNDSGGKSIQARGNTRQVETRKQNAKVNDSGGKNIQARGNTRQLETGKQNAKVNDSGGKSIQARGNTRQLATSKQNAKVDDSGSKSIQARGNTRQLETSKQNSKVNDSGDKSIQAKGNTRQLETSKQNAKVDDSGDKTIQARGNTRQLETSKQNAKVNDSGDKSIQAKGNTRQLETGKQNAKVNDSNGKNIQAKGNTRQLEIAGTQKVKVNNTAGKSVLTKVNTRQQEVAKQTDWESVMDALLKHKTPSRGPNALDMALNKDTYLSAYESSLRNPRLLRSPDPSSESDTVQTQALFEADTGYSRNSPNIPGKSNIDIIKETKSKSRHSSRSQRAVENSVSDNQTSCASVPGLHLDHHSTDKQRDAPAIPKKLQAELKKQQFTCPLPQEDDPFISGNLNSDYDLLEELIDDDLRQEIGELLSDDDCYTIPSQALKDAKSFVDLNTNIIPVIPENKRCVASTLVNTSITNPNLKRPTQRLPCQNVSKPVFNTPFTVKQPTSYVSKINTEPTIIQNISSVQAANTIHQIPKSLIVQPNAEQNYVNVKSIPRVDQTFVALPQQTSLQNVVLIGSELVYQPCAQAPLRTGIPQNTYVAFKTQPNIAVYQTTQFAAPVVNPLIIGNAMTTPRVPVDMSAITMSHSTSSKGPEIIPSVIERVNEPIKNEIQKSDATEKTDAQEDKKSVEFTTQDDTAVKEKSDNNTSKNCERKVLSEVQEKQKLGFTEKLDSKTIKTQRLSFENEVKKTVEHDRLHKKRMAILNRNIYHRSDNTPIPLTYTPLKTKKPEVTQEKHHNFRNVIKATDRHNEMNVNPESVINTKTITLVEPEPIKVKENDGNENCKENKNLSCRRILLRSSNKVNSEIIEKPSSVKTKRKKSKVRLKVTSENLIESGSEVKNKNVNKKRALIKTIKKTKRASMAIIKRITRQTRKDADAILNSATENKPEKERNATVVEEKSVNTNDFIDIEDQITGSMILKKTSCEPVFVNVPDALNVNDGSVSMNTNNEHPGDLNNILSPKFMLPNEVKITALQNNSNKADIEAAKNSNESTDLKKYVTEAYKDCKKKEDRSENENEPTNFLSNELINKEYDNILEGVKHPTDLGKERIEPEDSSRLIPPTDIGANDQYSINEVITKVTDKPIEKANLENSTVMTAKTSQTTLTSLGAMEVIWVDGNTKNEKTKTNTLNQHEFDDKITQSFLDSIKIEDIENPDPNDPLKRCVRIKLPNGRAFKATVRGQSKVNIENLFGDPALRKVLLSNISNRNRYTLNIKQISTSNKIQPDKILETRIEKITLQKPKKLASVETINSMETINLLSDDEEDRFQYFHTEFGKYKVPTMKRKLYESHQKSFDKKCVVKFKKVSLQQSVVTPSIIEAVKEPEIETICADVITTESVTTALTKNIQNATTKNAPLIPEVIEIDDSSSDDLNFNAKNLPNRDNEAKTCAEKIQEFKNLLLKDLGVDEIDDSMTSLDTPTKSMDDKSEELIIPDTLTEFDEEKLEELIIPDILTTELSIHDTRKYDETILQKSPTSVSLLRNCFVKLTNCDKLVQKYNNLKLIKDCSIKLVRCDVIQEDVIDNNSNNTINVDESFSSSINFVPANGYEVIDMPSRQPLSRSGSFSILNDLDLPGQPSLSDDVSRSTSPVMEAYETFTDLQIWKTDNKFRMYKQCRCEAEWILSKSLMWLQNKIAWGDYHGHRQDNKDYICKPSDTLIMDNNTVSKEPSVRQIDVPNLVAIITKYFQEYHIVDRYSYLYKPISWMHPSHDLKRKSFNNIPKSGTKQNKSNSSIPVQSISIAIEDVEKVRDCEVFVETPPELMSTYKEKKTRTDLAQQQLKSELTVGGTSNDENCFLELKHASPIAEELEQRNENENIGQLKTNKEIHPKKSTLTKTPSIKQQHDKNMGTDVIDPKEKQSSSAGQTLQIKMVESTKISVTHNSLIPESNGNMDLDLGVTEECTANAYGKDVGAELINPTVALIPQHDEDTIIRTVDLIINAENPEQPSNCVKKVLNESMKNSEILDTRNGTREIVNMDIPKKTDSMQPNPIAVRSVHNSQNENKSLNLITSGPIKNTPVITKSSRSKQEIEVKHQHQDGMTEDNCVFVESSYNQIVYVDTLPKLKLTTTVAEKEESINFVTINSTPTETKQADLETSCIARDNTISNSNENASQDIVSNSVNGDQDFQTSDKVFMNISSKLKEIFGSHNENANSGYISDESKEQNTVEIIEHSYTLNDNVTSNKDYENQGREVTETGEGIPLCYKSCNIQSDTIVIDDNNEELDLVEDVVDMRSDEIIEDELAHIVLGYSAYTTNILNSINTGNNLVTLDDKYAQTKLENKDSNILADNDHQSLSKPIPMSFNKSNVKSNLEENNSRNCSVNGGQKVDEELAQIVLGCKNSKCTRNELIEILDDGVRISYTTEKIIEHGSNKLASSSLNSDTTFNKNNDKIVDPIILNENYAFLKDIKKNLVEEVVKLRSNDELEQELARIVSDSTNSVDDEKQILIINTDNLEFDEVKVCCIKKSEFQRLIKGDERDISDQSIIDYGSTTTERNNSFLDDDNFSQSSEDILQITQEIDEYGNVKDIDIRLNVPSVTYSRRALNDNSDYKTFGDKKNKKGLKRKGDMADVKTPERKYRKGKNIDTPKLTAASKADTTYVREFKRLFDYCSTIKFSYSRPFHKEYIDVDEMLKSWPIAEVSDVIADFHIDENLFIDVENKNQAQQDPLNRTLAEEIGAEYSEKDYSLCHVMETNFLMGFGERSGRVIQNSEDGGGKFSAATLSDVKQTQPLLLSENYNCNSVQDVNNIVTTKNEIDRIQRNYKCIQLKEKIRSFFRKTMVELNNDCIKQNKKHDDMYSNGYSNASNSSFPFGLNRPDFIKPPPVEVVVQVVQVGQLPVSAAAPHPVTCDPRVTQVSNASPSQCTAENGLSDDPHSVIKTEYTELTTADINLPLHGYAQHHSQLLAESQNSSNIMHHEFIIEEIKEEIKQEIKEEPEISDEASDHYTAIPNNVFSHNGNYIMDNVNYSYEGAAPPHPVPTLVHPNMEVIYNSTRTHQQLETHLQQYHHTELQNKNQHVEIIQHSSDNLTHILQQNPQVQVAQQDQQPLIPQQNLQDQTSHQSPHLQHTQEKIPQENQKEHIFSEQPPQHNQQAQIIQQNLQPEVAQQNHLAHTGQQNQQHHIEQQNEQTQIAQQNQQAHIAQQSNQTQIVPQNQQVHVVQQNPQAQIKQQNRQAQITQQNQQAQITQQNQQAEITQQNQQAEITQQNQQAQITQQNLQGHIAQNQQLSHQKQQVQLPQQEQQAQVAPQTHVVQLQLSHQNLQAELPQQERNSTQEKTDQIAHAMNAAGITTSPENLGNTRAHALVNILSQKLRQGSVGGSPTNSYPKTAQITALALQQALAQILPPPLNQTNVTENSQPNSHSQVLHIVQGKSASSNQITLVDNNQPSVINAPNATPVLHIVQNKNNVSGSTTNGTPTPQTNSFSGLSLVDAGLQQGNQLLHIVNAGNQKNTSAGQLLRKVNLLTNLANVQGSNEQKMVQFVCKSSDGKSIQLNSPHPRGMVLRIQPVESPNLQMTQTKPTDSQESSPASSTTNSVQNKETGASQQEIKSRSIYEENYAKFIQSSNKTSVPEKATSLPKFGQAFGKQVFQEGTQKTDMNSSNPHLQSSSENPDCQPNDDSISLDHISQMSSPPLLLRKSPQTSQAQPNLVQQLKQTMAPVNMSMHGGVIYTRQIPVNIGGGQTINLITVPSTELIDDSAPKHQGVNQEGIEQSIIKIVPQAPASSSETSDDNNSHIGNDNTQTAQSQPVLTQMRIKLPMLSKTPQIVGGTRLVRPSFFQIQRNVIGGANQPVYQQLVLTAAPTLGQQTIRLPQTQTNRHVKVSSESQSSSESQMSSSTLEQLREFDLVLEQVKERSTGTGTAQPNATPSSSSSSSSSSFSKQHTSSKDTTDSSPSATSTVTETTSQVLYSIGNTQQVNVAYVNRKAPATTTTTTSFVRSPDSSGIVESSTSSTHHIRRSVSSDSSTTDSPATSTSHRNHSSHAAHTTHATQQPKPAKVKPKPRPKAPSNPPNTLKLPPAPTKTSTQKPAEDEQTTQRILYILAEYKEQVENSPDKDKPAPRRRTNPPSNPGGSSKRKKNSRRSGPDMSPCHGEDTCRTMGSEDSSCGTSQGDCNESCIDSHSPQDSPRKVVRRLTFEQETLAPLMQPRPQPPRNVIVADGQTITVARGTAGKPTTAVLMPANYILPVSMMKGGQQIAIVTNRGPKLLTVAAGDGGATNTLLLQRLIGPGGLKPMLARPGVRHVRLPTSALHNLHAFNLTTATTVQPPDSTASPAPTPTPPDLVDTRATSSTWRLERDSRNTKPDSGSSPEGSEPWHLTPTDYCYEETVRSEHMDRTVLDPIPDRYSPDMEAQRIFDKMFDVDSKKSYMVDSHDDSPRCGYDIDASDCDDKAYHQVVHKKDGSHRQHRLTHVSAAALRHKYAILEHELRLQKSLSEECEDLGVDSPSASELFPEAELLFAGSPAPHDHTQEQAHHSHTPQPILTQSGILQPDMDDQITTEQLMQRSDHMHDDRDLGLGFEDVGIVTVSEDGMQATIQVDHEEFARSHPNTTFHTDEGEVHQSFTLSSLKSRHITSTILHSHRPQGTVLVTAPQTTVISQAMPETSGGHHGAIRYTDIDNMINSLPGSHYGQSSVVVRDDGLSRFDNLLNDSRHLHLSNTTSAIVHSSAHTTQVIRRVRYGDDRRDRDRHFLIDDDAKLTGEDSSRDATLESMGGDTTGSSPDDRRAALFWDSHSASGLVDFSSDSEKCCKSPSDDTSTDSSAGPGLRAHIRLDSVIKEARGHNSDDDVLPLRTYPAPRSYPAHASHAAHAHAAHPPHAPHAHGSGKTAPSAGAERGRRASGRALVKRGSCLCCVGDAPPRPKKPRARRPALDFAAAN